VLVSLVHRTKWFYRCTLVSKLCRPAPSMLYASSRHTSAMLLVVEWQSSTRLVICRPIAIFPRKYMISHAGQFPHESMPHRCNARHYAPKRLEAPNPQRGSSFLVTQRL
jgi:hypothetical protein